MELENEGSQLTSGNDAADHRTRAIVATFFVQVLYAGMYIFTASLYETGQNGLALNLFRVLIGYPILVSVGKSQGQLFVPRSLFPTIMKLAFLVSITMISFLLSLSYTSATNIGCTFLYHFPTAKNYSRLNEMSAFAFGLTMIFVHLIIWTDHDFCFQCIADILFPVMAPLTPAATLGVSILAKKEILTKIKFVGLSLGVCGTLAITPLFSSKPNVDLSEVIGLGLGFIYVISYSVFLVGQSSSSVVQHPAVAIVISTWSFVIPILVIGSALASAITASIEPFVIKSNSWGPLLYISIIGTAGPYVITAWTAGHVDPSFIALAQVLQPVIVGTMAFLILGEEITGQQVVAFIFIAASVMVSTYAQVDEQHHNDEEISLETLNVAPGSQTYVMSSVDQADIVVMDPKAPIIEPITVIPELAIPMEESPHEL